MLRRPMLRLRLALPGLLIIALVLALSAVLVRTTGTELGDALGAIVAGAFGDRRRIAVTLLRMAPLLLAGLAVAVAFRGGLWNIGAEGQLLVGSIAVVAVGTRTGLGGSPVAAPILLAVGAVAGAGLGALTGVLRSWRRVPEVISTIMLNFIAIELVSFSVQGPLKERLGRYPQSDALVGTTRLFSWGPLPAGVGIGLLAAVGLSILLRWTRAGFELRAAGHNPAAAEVAGIAIGRQAVGVLALSGALAGLAGAVELQGSIDRLYEGYAPGYGYTAIAVALLARLEPLLVLPAALLFAAIDVGSESMERLHGVPSSVSECVQAAVILAAAIAWRRSGGRS